MRPTPACVWWFAAGVPVALLAAVFSPVWATAWLAWIGLLVFAMGADAFLAPTRRGVVVTADVPKSLFVGDRGVLLVRVAAASGLAPSRVSVLADLGDDLVPAAEVTDALPAGGSVEISIPLIPRRRGSPAVHAVWARWTGPLRLVERRARLEVETPVPVLPDVRPVRAAALRLFANRDAVSGMKVERYAGDGSEFDSLKEYVQGLDPRAISWKATARHRHLVCQDFRAERDHQVVLAFDTGLRMREPLGAMPRLDHAIHAGLLLAYVALRTGDRVGLFAFVEAVRAYVAPAGGVESFARIQRATADLAYSTSETNFTLGLAELSTRLRRRSLVVVTTEFSDSVTAQLMVESLGRLARRHFVLFVAMRDPELEALAAAEPRSTTALHRAVVAADFVREREVVLKRLRRMGVHVIDVEPQRLSSAVVNRYLEVHRRELVG